LVVATNLLAHEMGPEPPARRFGEKTTYDFSNDIPAVDAAMRMCREARESLRS
jgi:hypothetical protein